MSELRLKYLINLSDKKKEDKKIYQQSKLNTKKTKLNSNKYTHLIFNNCN